MDPITIMALANGLIGLLETLAPKVKELFNNGDITAEQQAELLKRIDALRVKDYSGPEWKVS